MLWKRSVQETWNASERTDHGLSVFGGQFRFEPSVSGTVLIRSVSLRSRAGRGVAWDCSRVVDLTGIDIVLCGGDWWLVVGGKLESTG